MNQCLILIILGLFTICTSSQLEEPKSYDNATTYVIEENQLFHGIDTRSKRQVSYDSRLRSLISLALVAAMCFNAPSSDTETKTQKELKICTIEVRTLPYKFPLILDPGNHSKIIYPADDGMIRLFPGQQIFLSCSRDIVFDKFPSYWYLTATCKMRQKFIFNGEHDINTFECSNYPRRYIQLVKQAAPDYSRFKIGFVSDDRHSYAKIADVYYKQSVASTSYVISTLSKVVNVGQPKTQLSADFDLTLCCQLRVPKQHLHIIYKEEQAQKNVFRSILADDSVNRYVDKSKKYVFVGGLLTPDLSMVYRSEALATYALLNVNPQYAVIKDGNWARVEDHVTLMARTLHDDLTVITGTIGQLKLEDLKGKEHPMYLYVEQQPNGSVRREIPVPAYFIKIVYDSNRKTVVFVTSNNPFVASTEHLCDDRFQMPNGTYKMKYPEWKADNVELGYSYFCEYDDFINKSDFLLVDGLCHESTGLLHI